MDAEQHPNLCTVAGLLGRVAGRMLRKGGQNTPSQWGVGDWRHLTSLEEEEEEEVKKRMAAVLNLA